MLDSRHGKTKIVCTLGPSTTSTEILTQLIHAGMDVARLNLSHGTHEEHSFRIKNLREASRRIGEEAAILLDLQGPKIRIGDLSVPFVDLKAGATFRITTEQIVGDGNRVSTSYARLASDVRPGDDILLDDGKLRLRVLEVEGKDVVCEVVVGGKLSAK